MTGLRNVFHIAVRCHLFSHSMTTLLECRPRQETSRISRSCRHPVKCPYLVSWWLYGITLPFVQPTVVPLLLAVPEDRVTREDMAVIMTDLAKFSTEWREDEFVGVVVQLAQLLQKSGRAW